MDSVLGDLKPEIVVVYIDDITILSNMLEQILGDKNVILERINVDI